MKEKLNYRFAISILSLVFLANIILFMNREYITNPQHLYFTFFFLHNVNLNITYTICFLLVYSLCILEPYYTIRKNGYDDNCIIRLNYHKVRNRSLFHIIIHSILFKVLTDLLVLISIYIFWGKDTQYVDPTLFQLVLAFHQNPTMNFIIYLFISSIGLALWGCFQYTLIDFIHKKTFYLSFSSLYSLITVIGSSVLLSILFRGISADDRIYKTLASFFIPMQLFEPGSLWSGEGLLGFLTSAVFYSFCTWIGLKLNKAKRSKYG